MKRKDQRRAGVFSIRTWLQRVILHAGVNPADKCDFARGFRFSHAQIHRHLVNRFAAADKPNRNLGRAFGFRSRSEHLKTGFSYAEPRNRGQRIAEFSACAFRFDRQIISVLIACVGNHHGSPMFRFIRNHEIGKRGVVRAHITARSRLGKRCAKRSPSGSEKKSVRSGSQPHWNFQPTITVRIARFVNSVYVCHAVSGGFQNRDPFGWRLEFGICPTTLKRVRAKNAVSSGRDFSHVRTEPFGRRTVSPSFTEKTPSSTNFC